MAMEVAPIKVLSYVTVEGHRPYRDWFNSLRNMSTQQIIDARLTRLEKGLLGDCRWVGQGVFELKIDVGPGYRIYLGKEGKKIVILLHGGDKSTQNKDIKKAQAYWVDYLRRSSR